MSLDYQCAYYVTDETTKLSEKQPIKNHNCLRTFARATLSHPLQAACRLLEVPQTRHDTTRVVKQQP